VHPVKEGKPSGSLFSFGESMMTDRPLTGQQRRSVHHYVIDGKGVPTKAARLAGYSTPEVAGHRLMKLPQVRAAIDAAFEEFAGVGIRDNRCA
jgi:hypothetical protein